MEVRSNLDFASGAKIKNLTAASAAGEAVIFEQLDSLLSGLSFKDSVRAASTANINLSSPGATIDGITMSTGDRFLAKDQTTASQNGIYVFATSATAATRATDAATFNALEAAVVSVEEGTTNAGLMYRQSAVNGVIGTNAVTWVQFGTAAAAASETTSGIAEIATQGEVDSGTDDLRIVTPLKLATSPWAAKKFSSTFGDGTSTQYDITHNLGTVDILASVKVVSTGSEVICDWRALNTTTVRVNTVAAPTTNELRITISRG